MWALLTINTVVNLKQITVNNAFLGLKAELGNLFGAPISFSTSFLSLSL